MKIHQSKISFENSTPQLVETAPALFDSTVSQTIILIHLSRHHEFLPTQSPLKFTTHLIMRSKCTSAWIPSNQDLFSFVNDGKKINKLATFIVSSGFNKNITSGPTKFLRHIQTLLYSFKYCKAGMKVIGIFQQKLENLDHVYVCG